MKRRDPQPIPDEVIAHAQETVQGAAGMAVLNLIESGAGACYVTLEDTSNPGGPPTGCVVVCLDTENAERLIRFVEGLGGHTAARVS